MKQRSCSLKYYQKSRKTSQAISFQKKLQLSFDDKQKQNTSQITQNSYDADILPYDILKQQQKPNNANQQEQYKQQLNLKYQYKKIQMQKKIIDDQLIKLRQRYQKDVRQMNQKLQQNKKSNKNALKEYQNQVKINKQLAKGYKQLQTKYISLKQEVKKKQSKNQNQILISQKDFQKKIKQLKDQIIQKEQKYQRLQADLQKVKKQKSKQKNQIIESYEQKLRQLNSKLQVKVKQLQIVQQTVQNKRLEYIKKQKQNVEHINQLSSIIESRNQKIEELQKNLEVLESALKELEIAQLSINEYQKAITQKQSFLQNFVTQYQNLGNYVQKNFEIQFPQHLDLKGMIQKIHKQYTKDKIDSSLKIKAFQHQIQQIGYKINLLIEQNNFLKNKLEQSRSFNKLKERQIFLMGQKAQQLRKTNKQQQIINHKIYDFDSFQNQKSLKELIKPTRKASLPHFKSMQQYQANNQKCNYKLLKQNIKQNYHFTEKCSMKDLILKKCKDIVF